MNKIQQQQGVVLVISLVFLALMTIVGVTAMQGTTQEAKMANNAAQRGLAFQYAEAGLRIAAASLKKFLRTEAAKEKDSRYKFDNTIPGFREPVDTRITNIGITNIASYWMDKYDRNANSIHWCDEPANSPLCDTLSDEIKHEQLYVIEKLKDSRETIEAGKSMDSYKTLFRITARSTGNVTDAVVILQATILFRSPTRITPLQP